MVVGRAMCVVAMLAVWSVPGTGYAADSEIQAWLTESVAIDLGPATMMTIDSSQRDRRAAAGGDLVQFRLMAEQRVASGIEIGGGLLRSFTDRRRETRMQQQLILSHKGFALRTRLEQRRLSDADRLGWRLRQRLEWEGALDRDGRWIVGGAVEAFLPLNRLRADERIGLVAVRGQVSLQRRLNRIMAVELTYVRHHALREGIVNAPWLTLSWHL